jgi:mercuric ion transport protein
MIQRSRSAKIVAAGGLLGALGIASCCALPLALVSLGIGGAWVGNLVALTPYKPFLVVATTALLGYGYYCVYWRARRDCAAGEQCVSPYENRTVRISLWAATILFGGALAFEYLEPVLF